MTNAGISIRVSTTRQGEEGASVETQRQDCMAYAERQGWNVAMVEEDHQSGTDFARPGFRKLEDAAKRGEIDKLVVYDLSRFGRDQLGARIALREFIAHDVEVHTVTGGLVKDDMLQNIIMLVAEQTSRDNSVKVARASRYRAETGHWVALPPFGYDLVPCTDCGRGKKLSPNAQGAVVTEVARRFDAGQCQTEIREWLRREHKLAVDDGWIKRRLINPAYAGDVVYDRRHEGKFKKDGEPVTFRDAHPALIERETFDRIQGRFAAKHGAKAVFKPLDGLVFCGKCGGKMYRITGGSRRYASGAKKPYHYYFICGARHRFNTCDQERIPYRQVEQAINGLFPEDTIKSVSENVYQRLLAIVEPDIERLMKGASDVREKLEAEVKKLERQQEMVYEDRLEGRIPAELAGRKLTDIQERIKSAAQELKSLKHDTVTDWHTYYEAHFGLRIKALAPAQAELLRLLVERVVATGNVLSIELTDYAHPLACPTDA